MLVASFLGGFSSAAGQCPDAKPIQVHALLAGAFEVGGVEPIMQDSLRVHGLIPLTEPYTALGYVHVGGGGNELMHASLLNISGPDAIVDWVVVELRHPNDPGKRIATKSALLQRSGNVLGANGQPLSFCVPAGKYHVALRHRNHLGVMTQRSVLLDGSLTDVNFRDTDAPNTTRGGLEALRVLNPDSTLFALWPGDVSFDGTVRYMGQDNDRDPILNEIGGSVPTNVLNNVYVQPDVNMDSRVLYVGQGNDRDPVLVAVGGNVPTNVREDFIPDDSLVFKPNVHFVDSTVWVLDYAQSDLDSGFVLVFDMQGPIPNVEAGHTLVVYAAGGWIRVVTDVTWDGNTLTVQSEHGDFDDIIESGVLQYELDFNTATAFTSFGPLQFTAPNGLGFSGGLQDIIFNFQGGIVNTEEIYSSGTVIKELGLRGQVTLTGRMALQGQISPSAIDLGQQLLGFIPFVGPFALPMKLKIIGKAELEGSGSGSVGYGADFNTSGTIWAGARHNSLLGTSPVFDWELGTPSLVPTETGTASLNVAAELSLLLKFALSVNLIPIDGYVELGVGAKAEYAYAPGLGKHIAFTVAGKGAAGIEVAVGTNESSLEVAFSSDPWLEWKSPGKIELVSGWDQNGVVDQQLQAPIVVKEMSTLKWLGSEVATFEANGDRFHFDVHSGDGETSPLLEGVSNPEGHAEATWTLGPGSPNSDAQELRIHLRDGTGADVDGSPIAVAAWTRYQAQAFSGNQQVGIPEEPLTLPLQVLVRGLDAPNLPMAGIEVQFEITGGDGTLSSAIATTDVDGIATVHWTMGTRDSGEQAVIAHVFNGSGVESQGSPVTFQASFDPDKLQFATPSGNLQSGQASTQLGAPLRVLVTNANDEPLENQLVHFEVTSGGGSVSDVVVGTNAQGVATTNWTLGPDLGVEQHVSSWALDWDNEPLFGSPLEFSIATSACPATMTDIDGNVYPVVQIGTQCWTAENLRTRHYNNGDLIPFVADSAGWLQNWTYGAATVYNGEPWNEAIYGLLYNWPAVSDTRGVCPSGWHAPTDAEWTTLVSGLGGEEVAGSKLASTGTIEAGTGLWYEFSPELPGATNETGFTALPGGQAIYPAADGLGCWANFWSSTAAPGGDGWTHIIACGAYYVIHDVDSGSDGKSVRCVKD